MMLIAGTVPQGDLPLTIGRASMAEGGLAVEDRIIPCTQGTGAMISAALATTEYLKLAPPQVLVAGDTGQGSGSRKIYEYLIENISRLSPDVLALHYCLPDMALTRKLCEAVKECARRPLMIADAASMYAAKAAGLAGEFDMFTPDATEIAFLADPDATHPAYIARHLFDTDVTRAPELGSAAFKQKSAAGLLLVKGETDYIMRNGEILATVSEPDVPALETIGGTGDTITGLVAAFIYAGLGLEEAAVISAKANRMAGDYAGATPATKVQQIIDQFPSIFKDHLCEWGGVCYIEEEKR